MATFVPASWQRIALTLAALGRGLRRGVLDPTKIEVMPSADTGNQAGYGSDGGIYVPTTYAGGGSSKTLPAVTTADNGKLLQVSGANWVAAAYVPPALSLLKTEFFTATSLRSNSAGWTKDARAKWLVIIAVGGGGSGGAYIGGTSPIGNGGGEPGSVELWRGWASDLPSTADVIIGSGGAAPTTTTGYANGSPSSFGSVLSANGGMGGANPVHKQFTNNNSVVYYRPPQCSFRLGIPGSDYFAEPEDSVFGPGAGGGPLGGSHRGGSSCVGTPASMVAGAAVAAVGATNSGGNGIAGDPYSFGSGGSSSGNNTVPAGNGGVPGGGGGGGYSGNGSTLNCAPGAGGRGEVRVLTYG